MAKNRIYGYARVSSREQNLDRQIDALRAFEGGIIAERDIITDKASGKDFDRRGWQALKTMLRDGDTVVVLSLDRLGRSYAEIQTEWRHIVDDIGANIVVIDMPLLDTRATTDGSIDKRFLSDLVLQILSYVAEKERLSIRQRQRQGIESAKAKGKHLGRPRIVYPSNWDDVIAQMQRNEITKVKAQELLGLKPTTFYKLLKQYHKERSDSE